jgi:hypothetical protein
MRHCRQYISESVSFIRERGTYNDDLNGNKEDDDQFHPRGRCLLQHEIPVIRVAIRLGAHLSQQLTQHGLQLSGISNFLVNRTRPRFDF